MNPIKKAKNQYFIASFITVILCLIIGSSSGLISYYYLNFSVWQSLTVAIVLAVICGLAVAEWLSDIAIAPIRMVDRASQILANEKNDKLPDPGKLSVAKDLTRQALKDIYDITTNQHVAIDEKVKSAQSIKSLIDNIYAPVLSVDRNHQVNFFNDNAQEIANPTIENLKGCPLKQAFDFKFIDDIDIYEWMKESEQDKIHDARTWQRVKLNVGDDVRYFDLSASYNKNDSQGHEYVLSMIDFTKKYGKEDKEISFVSLAVHELRSPLTVLRGYIEVFQEEVGPKLGEDYERFMNKMSVSAEQLSTFVNNILNVSRIENEQMQVNPQKEDWLEFLKTSFSDFKIRGSVRNRNVTLNTPDDLPEVAADLVSVYEVLSNLIDNAIKYTEKEGNIEISTKELDNGFIETTVKDDGIGIPNSVIGNLFNKFYRSHRSRENIGGTGLGLFLSKQIVEAHMGEIWVESKEGEGSTFGFNLPTYKLVAEDLKNPDKMTLRRSTHGWIKNHGKIRK